MNKNRRKQLDEIKSKLEEITATAADLVASLESIRDDEQEYYDNMPEAIQYSEKGERAEAAVSALEDAISQLEDVSFDDVVSQIEAAAE